MSVVVRSQSEGVLSLTFNRPERLNAVTAELYQALIDGVDAADRDPNTRAIILSGAGRAFCAGADLKAHGESPGSDKTSYTELAESACRAIQTSSTPVIAAVHGYAIGAGAELAVSADFLVMNAQAQIGFPEARLGTFVGGGITRLLPRIIGMRKATEMLFLGNRITGAKANEWGLATRCDDDVLTAAHDIARELSANAPLSIGLLKSELARESTLDQALQAETKHLQTLMQTNDWSEGVSAFAQRRTPEFQGH